MFQSTHPHGVRLSASLRDCKCNSFNPRTRTGCDWRPAYARTIHISFNPRTRTGCDCRFRRFNCFFVCFNPRTRTGCDNIVCDIENEVYVSIHAPARGATSSLTRSTYIIGVSIHAPARGATLSKAIDRRELQFQSTHPHGVRLNPKHVEALIALFQSTHPHGVRHLDVISNGLRHNVSIHAPARGATVIIIHIIKSCKFQSTHPHGVRPQRSCTSSI